MEETQAMGTRIAQALTAQVSVAFPELTYARIEESIYAYLRQHALDAQPGDWIELPDGTTYTLSFKPTTREGSV